MSKLTQTLIEDVLKSKEDIKRVLNENIQSVFKDVIKEGLSELLEKEDESFESKDETKQENQKKRFKRNNAGNVIYRSGLGSMNRKTLLNTLKQER